MIDQANHDPRLLHRRARSLGQRPDQRQTPQVLVAVVGVPGAGCLARVYLRPRPGLVDTVAAGSMVQQTKSSVDLGFRESVRRWISPCFRDQGGDEGNRTPNPRLAKAVLCQLSYVPGKIPARVGVGIPGLEPGTSSLSAKRSNRLSYIPRWADTRVSHRSRVYVIGMHLLCPRRDDRSAIPHRAVFNYS